MRDCWICIEPTNRTGRYISAECALNLHCPSTDGSGGDWHRTMWQVPASVTRKKRLTVRTGPWPTWEILGNEGIYDARGALRRACARWRIFSFFIGGHPTGYGLRPVWAAEYARAVVDLASEAIFDSVGTVLTGRELLPPRQALLWAGPAGSCERMLRYARALRAHTGGEAEEKWEAWIEQCEEGLIAFQHRGRAKGGREW